MVWCPSTISEHLMWSKERLSITSARQNTSILKQKLLFITIMDSRDMYYKQALNFRMHQHSIQRLRIFNFIENFFSKCGQRMADSDAGEGNKNLEYSSKFIRQILLQETPCAKPPPFLHWINIPQNWSMGTFGNVLFLSLSTPGREVLRETTSEGFYGRWAISGTVNWRRWPGTTINGPLLISGVGGRPFSDVKPLSTKMCTVDSFCGQEAPNCPSLDTMYLMFGEGLQPG